MNIHITAHAIARFRQRVTQCSAETAREAIMSHAKAIRSAADFGCEIVRCGGGERLVLDGTRVLTVYGAGQMPMQCRSPFYPGEDERPL